MEKVTIWYCKDNDDGDKIVNGINGLGLTLNTINGFELKRANIIESEINIFIFDITGVKPNMLIEYISQDRRLQGFLKFIILKKKQIKDAMKLSFNMLHTEFLNRPVDRREFLLLLEKSIIVERYREIMKFISHEAEARIEAYEGLMDINRKNVFESEKEKMAFEKILAYEKNLMREQSNLSMAIRDFTLLRQGDMFDMRNRIAAEEMLSDLRRREMMDAKNVIVAQESVIDYSARELNDAQKLFHAAENVAELSRSESLELHEELKRQKRLNKELSAEIEKLLAENEALKEKLNLNK